MAYIPGVRIVVFIAVFAEVCQTACPTGRYGSNCFQTCRYCPDSCHQDTGHCASCPWGKHGGLCNETCPTQCKELENKPKCNIQNGRCENGCIDGFHGKLCNISCGKCQNRKCSQIDGDCRGACVDGYYGNACNYSCGRCVSGSCLQISGECHIGCAEGWTGTHCSTSCVERIPHCVVCGGAFNKHCQKCQHGYYGKQCGISNNLMVESISTSPSTAITPFPMSNTGLSKAVIDTILVITLAVFLIGLAVAIFVYDKFCSNKKQTKVSTSKQQFYTEDKYGSPVITRKQMSVGDESLLDMLPR